LMTPLSANAAAAAPGPTVASAAPTTNSISNAMIRLIFTSPAQTDVGARSGCTVNLLGQPAAPVGTRTVTYAAGYTA